MDPWDPIVTALVLVGALVVAAAAGYWAGCRDQKRIQEREGYSRWNDLRVDKVRSRKRWG